MTTRPLHLGLLLATLVLVAAFAMACDYGHPGDDETTEPCEAWTVRDKDPCVPNAPEIVVPGSSGGAQHTPPLDAEPVSLASMLDDGYDPPSWVTHMVVRGVYQPTTARCTSDERYRLPDYGGGRSLEGHPTFKCYIEVLAQEYIVGAGPRILTVMLFNAPYRPEEFGRVGEQVSQETVDARIERRRQDVQGFINGTFPGREHILLLGPDLDISTMVLRLMAYWDVQRQTNPDRIVAIHPRRDRWREEDPAGYQQHKAALEMELPAFRAAMMTAHTARVTANGGRIGTAATLPMLSANANDLQTYYVEVGAYDDEDNPPAMPPPPACGKAVPNRAGNPRLVQDCFALLDAKDTLRGSAALNWSVDTAMADWDGVRTRGIGRVTDIILVSKELTGTVPAELGSLSGLTHLDLSANSLTGSIPVELALLQDIQELRLSENSPHRLHPPGAARHRHQRSG